MDAPALAGVAGVAGLYALPRYVRDFGAWEAELRVTWGAAPLDSWFSPDVAPLTPDAAARRVCWMLAHCAGAPQRVQLMVDRNLLDSNARKIVF